MKKLSFTVLLMMLAVPAFAQTTTIYNNNSRSPLASGIGNTMNNNRSTPTMTNPIIDTQGTHIKSLEERRQERILKQNQQLQKSGINVQQIQNPQQQGNVINIQPQNPNNAIQNLPNMQTQQLQSDEDSMRSRDMSSTPNRSAH
jgi:hypothetical protein